MHHAACVIALIWRTSCSGVKSQFLRCVDVQNSMGCG